MLGNGTGRYIGATAKKYEELRIGIAMNDYGCPVTFSGGVSGYMMNGCATYDEVWLNWFIVCRFYGRGNG